MPIPTPHITAKAGDFAPTVLMPGDPLRAQFIADHYLQNARLVNNVRGMLGFTGLYHGKPVSVMASGMGQPSIGIYSYELYKFYDVQAIIRIGSCGAIAEGVHVRDLIIAQGACTNGNFAAQYRLPGTFAPIATYDLVRRAADICEAEGLRYHVGNVLSSDVFYDDASSGLEWARMGVLGVEMESAALYCTAARLGKQALCICTVSDNLRDPAECTTAEERQTSFTDMMQVALQLA